ncbi:MAG: Gfo/Idh/MocA family oxidoreductase [Planctomycetales bacterium]
MGYWVAGGVTAQESKSPNEKVRFACVGVGGKGGSDSNDARGNGDVVAICDVDDKTLDKAAGRVSGAKKFNDFREMFDKVGNSFDAVTVSTPDHMHAPVAAMALHHGKHTFCQKPMTRTISEARALGDLARKQKVATQMGNQGTAANGLRKSAALVKAGILGTVKEVHVWTNRPIWPQGVGRPDGSSVPGNVHWDLWLGVAPERPYSPQYHPFKWRGWWDFGTGALGDMACHTMNMPFMALDLRDPISVEAKSSGHDKDSFPKWSVIQYEFAARGDRPALTMYWHDGGKRPSADLLDGEKPGGSGSLIIGDKGKLYSPGDSGNNMKLLGGASETQVEYPKSPGHFKEWVQAIQGGQPAKSNFPDYAAPLTETVLLGNLAVWAGKKVDWDAKNLKATNAPEVQSLVTPEYTKGYSL